VVVPGNADIETDNADRAMSAGNEVKRAGCREIAKIAKGGAEGLTPVVVAGDGQ